MKTFLIFAFCSVISIQSIAQTCMYCPVAPSETIAAQPQFGDSSPCLILDVECGAGGCFEGMIVPQECYSETICINAYVDADCLENFPSLFESSLSLNVEVPGISAATMVLESNGNGTYAEACLELADFFQSEGSSSLKK